MDQSASPAALTLPPAQQLRPVARLAWLRGRRFFLLPLGALVLLALLIILQAQSAGMLHVLVVTVPSMVVLAIAGSGAILVSLRVPRGRTRWAWLCISLAFLWYLIAECIKPALTSAGLSLLPFSTTGQFRPFFYPLLVIGLLLLPSPTFGRGARGRLLVEVGIIALAVLGLSLLFIIVPFWSNVNNVSLVGKVFLTLYPVGDVALVATLVLLMLRTTESALQPVFLWLALGIALFVYADSALYILSLHTHAFSDSPLVDPFSTVGELLMGLSAWFYLAHGDEPGVLWGWLTRMRETPTRASWQSWCLHYLFPYFPAALLLFFLIAREMLPMAEWHSAYMLEAVALAIILLAITRQIILSNDLVDARLANQRAQQLDALKDQFITSVNHELRTPLMTMQTYIELLRHRQQELPERSSKVIEAIGRTNDALVDLVQSILEVRRLDQESLDFPREAVDLQNTLERAISLISPREGKMSERVLHVDVPPGLLIWGETVRLQQVLTNLLSNAIKYSPPGAAIEVSAKVVQAENGRRARSIGQGPMVRIQVRDYGLGIPPEQIPLLFHRFVRLPRDLASNVVGNGLGLYLCQQLTEAMGGTIRVESEGLPGKGSTFSVQLPLAEPLRRPQDAKMAEAYAD
jgi:signal transduction histidine kinase